MVNYKNNGNDFGVFFHQKDNNLIDYKMRNDQNKLHDIIYISSYIHEAMMSVNDISVNKRTLIISLDRIRWELFKETGSLVNIQSNLIFRNVRKYHLQFSDLTIRRQNKFEICNFSFFDNQFYIETTFNRLKVTVDMLSGFNLRLVDTPKK